MSAFDDLTDVYEATVDWPKRLGNESPFYRRLLDRLGAKRVVDVACGTGRHAAMLHEWSLSVEAADISPRMIDHARASFGEPDGLRWVVRGFDQQIPAAEAFDVALCVGNSLALATDLATVDRAIERMLSAIRPGGAIVVQVLNLWRLPDGPCLWQKCVRTTLAQTEVLVVKAIHRSVDRGFVELLVLDPSGAIKASESVPFLGLEAAELERAARSAGAERVTFYGDYKEHPYVRGESGDLIMVAEK